MSLEAYIVAVIIGGIVSKIINIVNIQRDFGDNQSNIIQNIIKYIKPLKIKKQSIVTLHELSLTRYFPITKEKKISEKFSSIIPNDIDSFLRLCEEKEIFLVLPFCEKNKDKNYFNSTIIISPFGKIIAKQRKRFIPDETCYQENHYFNKSNKIKIFDIGICKVGILICWDQWYPENYKKLYNQKVDIIISPTSIGYASKNNSPITLKNEKKNWEMTIRMNSLLVNTPVVVTNRCSTETRGKHTIRFWGSSFITNSDGEIVKQAACTNKTIITSIDLRDKPESLRKWGFKIQ